MSITITPNARNTGNWSDFVPEKLNQERPEVRMNWNTPFVISHFNPHTIYYGGNFLYKSIDRGDHWMIISPDLSTQHPDKTLRESGGLTRDVTSAETHCTIVTISESILQQGLIWTGTDDGNIQLTQDDGATWKNVRENIMDIPEGLWVSRIEASHFEKGTCYVTLDGHRSDVFKPFVLKTEDFGQTWTDITNNLPDGHCTYVIKEDLKNKDLLFVGTEFAVFASLDGGKSWSRLMNGLPTVAVHDLLIHPRDNDLIAGTHGRGVWILDDISPLQQLTQKVMESGAFLFENPTTTVWEGISRGATRGHQLFIGTNPLSMSQVDPSNSPSPIRNTASINYYIKEKPEGKPVLKISDLSNTMDVIVQLENTPGIHRYRWNMRFKPGRSAVKAFTQRLESAVIRLQDRVDKKQKKKLDQLEKELNPAKTLAELNSIQQTLTEEFAGLGGGRGFFGREAQGPLAEPGTYRLELTVGGQSYTGLVTIRKDPLLK
jgi:hypothetical protein